MSLLNCFQPQHGGKRKLDDCAPDEFSASVRMRNDINNSSSSDLPCHEVNLAISDGRPVACLADSSKSNSTLQFFVRMLSGMSLFFVQANVDDTVESVHKLIESRTGIPICEQRLIYQSKQLYWEQTLGDCYIEKDSELHLVGVMRSTIYAKAYQLVDEMLLLMCRLREGKSKNESNDNEMRRLIKHYFLTYFDRLPKNDIENSKGYLEVFMSLGAPAALALFYMSPGNKVYGTELIKELLLVINHWPQGLFQQYCAPILLEICRFLRCSPLYEDDIFKMCQNILVNMMGYIKIGKEPNGGNSLVPLRDIVDFVGEAANRIYVNMHAGLNRYSLLPLMSDVHSFKNFMIPVQRFYKEEFLRLKIARASKNGNVHSFPKNEYKYLDATFHKMLEKMNICLKEMEELMHTDSVSLGCYQYLAILMEVNKFSLLFPGVGKHLWEILRDRKISFCYLITKYASRSDDYGWISEHKEVTNFECRRHLAMMLLPEIRDEYDDLLEEMLIERSQLLAESFEYIAHAEPDTLRAGLSLEFKNEEATGPGVLREWFVLVCQAIFDPQNALFVACPNDRRRFFPNPASKVNPLHLEYFRFAGRVIALALIHKVQVGIVFDRVLFLQLAGKNVSIEDIHDADPFLYNSCKKILEIDPEVVDQDVLGLTFIVETDNLGSKNIVELCPDGKNIVVNGKNRRNYVDLLLQYHFVYSVAEQVAQFTRGFDDIINSSKLRKSFFQCLELKDLDGILYGTERALSIEDWKYQTDYHGYKETDPQISWFWQTIGTMSAEQRNVLLFFWTSLKYLPIEGFRGLSSRLSIYKTNDACNHLPRSHTCFYQLCLPPYKSLEDMQDRLGIITQEHVGCSFGTA